MHLIFNSEHSICNICISVREFVHRDWFTWGRQIPKIKLWTEWATLLSTGEFVVWLAGHIADDLFAKRAMTVDQMVYSIDNTPSHMQKDAELFLMRLYLPYSPFLYKRRRVTKLFRHLIQRQIRRRG